MLRRQRNLPIFSSASDAVLPAKIPPVRPQESVAKQPAEFELSAFRTQRPLLASATKDSTRTIYDRHRQLPSPLSRNDAVTTGPLVAPDLGLAASWKPCSARIADRKLQVDGLTTPSPGSSPSNPISMLSRTRTFSFGPSNAMEHRRRHSTASYTRRRRIRRPSVIDSHVAPRHVQPHFTAAPTQARVSLQ